MVPSPRAPAKEFEFEADETENEAAQSRRQADRLMARNARTASLDPDDGVAL
jgi:type IV secretion system protein VirD4